MYAIIEAGGKHTGTGREILFLKRWMPGPGRVKLKDSRFSDGRSDVGTPFVSGIRWTHRDQIRKFGKDLHF
jgi:hypothetical protein